MTLRLYLDGSKVLWFHVRCDVCTDVDQYLADEAAQSPIICKKCGRSMHVRDQVLNEAAKLPHTSLDGFIALTGARRPRSPEVLDR